jgi:hypothetical protein
MITAEDLDRIEQELGLQLPGDYRSLMLDYPFPADSYTAECLLVNDPEALKELAAERDPLPPQSFIVGDDGGEELYFIDLTRASSPVYVFQLETGQVKEASPSLQAYVQACEQTEREINGDEVKRSDRKWWQFWRR